MVLLNHLVGDEQGHFYTLALIISANVSCSNNWPDCEYGRLMGIALKGWPFQVPTIVYSAKLSNKC